MRDAILKRGAALLTALLAITAAATAQAQPQQPIPPERYTIDERGVDLTSGLWLPQVTEVVIGEPGAGGLAYGRVHIGTGWRDNFIGTINAATRITVSLGGRSVLFAQTMTPGEYEPLTPDGSSLILNTSTQIWTYTDRSGMIATLDGPLAHRVTPYEANEALLTGLTFPTGEIVTYAYRLEDLCIFDVYGECSLTTPVARTGEIVDRSADSSFAQYAAYNARADYLDGGCNEE